MINYIEESELENDLDVPCIARESACSVSANGTRMFNPSSHEREFLGVFSFSRTRVP